MSYAENKQLLLFLGISNSLFILETNPTKIFIDASSDIKF